MCRRARILRPCAPATPPTPANPSTGSPGSGRFDSWESLGNNQLLIFTTPNDAYLLSVTPPCTDLPFVQNIALTSTSSTVSARLDSVIVKGWRCQIAEIRKVDYTRMRAEMRQEAEAAKAATKPAS